MAHQLPVGPVEWCTPSTISPATWIPGFSDNKNFMCAAAVSQPDLVTKLENECCKGKLQTDDAGCYHWCEPSTKDYTAWATCISDNVYTNELKFGQACNMVGNLEVESAKSQDQVPRKGPVASAGVTVSASWKVGVLVGVVGLLQVLC